MSGKHGGGRVVERDIPGDWSLTQWGLGDGRRRHAVGAGEPRGTSGSGEEGMIKGVVGRESERGQGYFNLSLRPTVGQNGDLAIRRLQLNYLYKEI